MNRTNAPKTLKSYNWGVVCLFVKRAVLLEQGQWQEHLPRFLNWMVHYKRPCYV